jgi:hypothetical protein
MFVVFFAVVLLVMGSVHGYLYARLVVATALPSPWRGILGLLLLGAVLTLPLSFVVSRALDKDLARFFVVPAYVWLGFVFLTFALVLGLDLVRLAASLLGRGLGGIPALNEPVQALRLWRYLAGGAVAVTAGATLLAMVWGLTRLEVREVEVTLPGLPPALDGFTILQLSDLHLDLVHGGDWLEGVVDRAMELRPDLIAITGDLAEGSVAQFREDVEPLRRLSAPHGVYFVTGNHEYFHDLGGWLRLLDELGVRVLRNEQVAIARDGVGFDLAGVDDHEGGRLAEGHGPSLDRALAGRDPDRALVLLAHQPRVVEEAAARGVGLVLSGHTHGGQIWPFSYLVYLQQPYLKGLVRHQGTWLYVSAGTGFWGPPMRLGTTAEITVLTLRARGHP